MGYIVVYYFKCLIQVWVNQSSYKKIKVQLLWFGLGK